MSGLEALFVDALRISAALPALNLTTVSGDRFKIGAMLNATWKAPFVEVWFKATTAGISVTVIDTRSSARFSYHGPSAVEEAIAQARESITGLPAVAIRRAMMTEGGQ